MPRISEFFGIVITMNFNDHPPPHIHARYGGFKAKIAIRSLVVLKGRLPPGQMAMVRRWASLHQAELMLDWELAQHKLPLIEIPPLD